MLRAQTKQNSGSAVIERHQLSFDALTALEAFALNLFSPNDLKKTLPRSLVRRRLRANTDIEQSESGRISAVARRSL